MAGRWSPAELRDLTGPGLLGESRGPLGPAKLSRYARDEQLAARLWDLRNELSGARWPF